MQRQKQIRRAGWEELSNAIVEQAAHDYRRARRVLAQPEPPPDANEETLGKHMRRKARAYRRMREVEQFFRSDWCKQLTGADGQEILSLLRREQTRT